MDHFSPPCAVLVIIGCRRPHQKVSSTDETLPSGRSFFRSGCWTKTQRDQLSCSLSRLLSASSSSTTSSSSSVPPDPSSSSSSSSYSLLLPPPPLPPTPHSLLFPPPLPPLPPGSILLLLTAPSSASSQLHPPPHSSILLFPLDVFQAESPLLPPPSLLPLPADPLVICMTLTLSVYLSRGQAAPCFQSDAITKRHSVTDSPGENVAVWAALAHNNRSLWGGADGHRVVLSTPPREWMLPRCLDSVSNSTHKRGARSWGHLCNLRTQKQRILLSSVRRVHCRYLVFHVALSTSYRFAHVSSFRFVSLTPTHHMLIKSLATTNLQHADWNRRERDWRLSLTHTLLIRGSVSKFGISLS